MELEKSLNEYLEKIEKYLKPMIVSERVDIVKEIKSEMLELQNNGISTEQIIDRLGNPKELAKAYLGVNSGCTATLARRFSHGVTGF